MFMSYNCHMTVQCDVYVNTLILCEVHVEVVKKSVSYCSRKLVCPELKQNL